MRPIFGQGLRCASCHAGHQRSCPVPSPLKATAPCWTFERAVADTLDADPARVRLREAIYVRDPVLEGVVRRALLPLRWDKPAERVALGHPGTRFRKETGLNRRPLYACVRPLTAPVRPYVAAATDAIALVPGG